MIPPKKILLSLIAVFCCSNASAQETVLVPAGSSSWKYNISNTNLGTSWRTVAYNDSTWLTGTAPIGYGDSPLGTTLPTPNPKPITIYYRHTFTLTALQASTLNSLGAEMRRDDGAVVYLNNVELFRTNMPAGTVNFSTTASSAMGGAQEFTFFNFDGLASSLVAGTNVLAVELHSSDAGSSDAHMDIKLLGYNVPPDFGVVGANRSIKFEEATFYSGDGVTDFVRAPGEGFLDYEWSSTELSGSGIFGAFEFAPASGDELASSEWSAWFVNCETESEHIDLRNFSNVKATFQARSFTDSGVSFSGSDFLRLGVTTSNDGFTFSTKLYAANLTGTGGEASITSVLIPESATKKVIVPTAATGSSWNTLGYNDSAWTSGTLGAGFDSAVDYIPYIGPTLNVDAEMRGKNSTLYMRIPFTSPDPSTLGGLALRMRYDDGFIAYLNGVKVAERFPPAGTPTWNSIASGSHEATTWDEIYISEFKDLLTAGPNNLLAIHGLNQSNSSSDMLTAVELVEISPGNLNDMRGTAFYTYSVDVPDTAKSMYIFIEGNTTAATKWVYADNIKVTGLPLFADSFETWVLLETDYNPDLPSGQAQGDGDGDSIANLLEYAFDANPMASDVTSVPSAQVTPRYEIVSDGGSEYFQMTYRQLNLEKTGDFSDGGYTVRDLQYIPQISTSGFDWDDGTNGPAVVDQIGSIAESEENTVEVTVRFRRPIVNFDEMFVRLKVKKVTP